MEQGSRSVTKVHHEWRGGGRGEGGMRGGVNADKDDGIFLLVWESGKGKSRGLYLNADIYYRA